MSSRPANNEYAQYYERYISLVPDDDILTVFETQITYLERLAGAVTSDKEQYRYAPDKWSIREVIGHLIDGERVFGYRAFCISRGEAASLPKFDENAYIVESHYHRRTLSDLLAEFALLRKSNLVLFSKMTESDWKQMGTANNNPVSVLAIAFIMAGHFQHHLKVLRQTYGLSA